jgi:hypothetical protein
MTLISGSGSPALRQRSRKSLSRSERVRGASAIRQLAAGGEIGQESLLLVVASVHRDPLHADRLVHTERHGQRAVECSDRLEHAGVTGLGEALTAVLLGHIESHEPALAQLAEDFIGDPALFVDAAGVDVFDEVREGRYQLAHLFGFLVRGNRIGEHDVLVDLPQPSGPC